MPDFEEMVKGARIMVDTLTDTKPNEQVLIVLDTATSQRIADAVMIAARERGAIPVVAIMDRLAVPNAEPPPTIAAAMQEADVMFSFVKQTLFHTQARLSASARGMRMLSCTGIVEDTLVRGPIKADFNAIKPIVDSLGEKISAGNTIRVISPNGTDLTASTGGRKANREIWSREFGQASGSPSIEVNVPPLEGTAQGVIVIDASIAGIGLITEPIRVTVKDGRAVKFEGAAQAGQLERMISASGDPRAFAIAEIGIGLNPEGTVTGNLFEDESAFGTAHIALGKNTVHGGQNPAPLHVDMVFLKPTIEIDGEIIVAPGKPTLPAHDKV